MKGLNSILQLVRCASLLATALAVPTSAQALDPSPPGGLNVNVVNTPLPVQGTLTGSVSITGTPNVNVVNTPTVHVGNALKPGQLVTLQNSSETPGSCPNGNGGILVDTLNHPDGTSSTFSIPTGQVLVITGAEAFGFGGVGDRATLVLQRVGTQVVNDLARQVTMVNSQNEFVAVFNFPTGAVVKSGVSLCLHAFDDTVRSEEVGSVRVHGYLAADE